MTHSTEPDQTPVVVVTVARTGGMAGIARRWAVHVGEDDAERWIALVEDCPWEACERGGDEGTDRFGWSVEVRLRDADHRAELSESQASGPWRILIDAVRAESASVAPEQ